MAETDRSEAARKMGQARSEKKAEAARRNLEKANLAIQNPGRKPWPLSRYDCTCGAEDIHAHHAWDCPRGQAIKRRLQKGQPLE